MSTEQTHQIARHHYTPPTPPPERDIGEYRTTWSPHELMLKIRPFNGRIFLLDQPRARPTRERDTFVADGACIIDRVPIRGPETGDEPGLSLLAR